MAEMEDLKMDKTIPVVIDEDPRNPLQVQVKQAKKFSHPQGADVYPMKSKPRGNVLIINNVEFSDENHESRIGSLVDSANLETLFTQLGFEVTSHKNLSLRETRTQIKKHADREDHSEADMGVVCLLSHGEKTNQMRTSDGELLDVEWVIKKYRSEECPSLHGKPKLFVIQACRGKERNSGHFDECRECFSTRRSAVDGDPRKVPNGEDILIVNATVPSFVAHRDKRRGSWFVECFCEVVMGNAFNTDLRDMLDMIANKLRGPKYEDEDGNKQIFESANRHFRKKLFFNPGLYEGECRIHQVSSTQNYQKMQPKEILNIENEILNNVSSDETKILDSLNRVINVFEQGSLTVDLLLESKIGTTLYSKIRPTYSVETLQGQMCRTILKKIQAIIKLDPDYNGEELQPITPLPTLKDFKNFFSM